MVKLPPPSDVLPNRPTRPTLVVAEPQAQVRIERPRLLQALAARAEMPIRFLCAPTGSGKTTLLRQYVAARPGAAYIATPLRFSSSALREILDGTTEVVLDDFDLADPRTVEGLMRAIASADSGLPRLIVAGRSRRLLYVQSLVARGHGAVLGARDLAFDRADVGQLGTALGLRLTRDDVTQLLHVTEGWTLPLTWMLRATANAGWTAREGVERWLNDAGGALLELVDEAGSIDDDARRSFNAVLAGNTVADNVTATQLEAAGCPVVRDRDGVRPYRILTSVAARGGAHPATVAAPEDGVFNGSGPVGASATGERMTMKLLGRFVCEVGGNPVAFARRRDRNVLAYIALAPGARVSRDELLAAFWPGVTHAVACQGLRTTLCRLRRAIADAANGADAQRYLRVDAHATLDLANVDVDARTFADLADGAERADRRGDADQAQTGYIEAERAYIGHLLESDAVEDPLTARVAEYAARFEQVLARLVDFSLREHRFDAVRTYERRALALSLPPVAGRTA
ncbi:MAG: hypothetical protein JO225_12425 [Candidatus Eremiobacteraeota bacterium]|nr:hypothetical protein [Candidatus Eremiobacteraeota bacterium]